MFGSRTGVRCHYHGGMSPTNAEPADEGSFAELFAEYEDQVPVARSARRAAGRAAGRPGTTDDDVEHLLRQRGTVVVIDGYNVAMRGWPKIGRAHV